MFLLVGAALLAFVALIYLFLTWNFDHWRKRGVNFAKPTILLGTYPSLLTQKQHFADDLNDLYKNYKNNESYVGTFLMRTPQLLLLDPALVHDVFVKDFKSFQHNDIAKLVDKKKDPLIANNPFLLTGTEWREQRAIVTPALTGARIKAGYPVMQQVCRNLCEHVERESKLASPSGINGKELALRFTCENVCDCVLGIKASSFTDHPLPVGENVRKFTDNNTIFVIYAIMSGIFPSIVNLYQAKFFPKDCERFFLDLMKEAYSMRTSNKVDRQDFINYMLTLQEKKQLGETEVVSHTMTFLIDGLDTTATVISHCLLLLGRNPSVQTKLRQEIMANVDGEGELSFEKLNELPYLDACVHESIRIFPPGLFSTKICTEPYKFMNKNGSKLQVNKGETIMIPTYALHHDAEYYNNPEAFQPERFMPENGGVKKYRDMGVFLGFGDGPRMCLGMRFALSQTKAPIASLVKSFNITVNKQTKPQNKLDPKGFLALQDGGVWLNFEKRV